MPDLQIECQGHCCTILKAVCPILHESLLLKSDLVEVVGLEEALVLAVVKLHCSALQELMCP